MFRRKKESKSKDKQSTTDKELDSEARDKDLELDEEGVHSDDDYLIDQVRFFGSRVVDG